MSSRPATRHAALAKPLEQLLGLPLVEQQQAGILEPAGGRVEVAAGGDAASVDREQDRLEALARLLGEGPQQIPERGRDEGHPLLFPLDDQSNRHALHAAGGKPAANLPPQQRRDVVAVEAVDDAADLLGTDQILVDLPRLRQGLADRLFGDFVEDQPVDGHLRLEHLGQVPTDGLSLAVFVGRQIEFAGVFQERLELANLFGSCPRE